MIWIRACSVLMRYSIAGWRDYGNFGYSIFINCIKGAALGGIIWSNLALRSIDVFGLQALRCHLRGTSPPAATLTERGPYRWVRHPQYFFILVMIWSYPDLTADRLLFNVLWSTWIVAGTLMEERDLAVTLGDRYREYQLRVPMLIPWRVPR